MNKTEQLLERIAKINPDRSKEALLQEILQERLDRDLADKAITSEVELESATEAEIKELEALAEKLSSKAAALVKSSNKSLKKNAWTLSRLKRKHGLP